MTNMLVTFVVSLILLVAVAIPVMVLSANVVFPLLATAGLLAFVVADSVRDSR